MAINSNAVKYQLSVLLIMTLLGVLGGIYIVQSKIDRDIERLTNDQRVAAEAVATSLAGGLGTAIRHVRSLVREKSIIETLNDPLSANLQQVADTFSSLIVRNPDYGQVRWIDETGRERVRVNNVGGEPVIVPVRDLQSKADRYYFTDIMNLSPGMIYVSRLDQSIEHDRVETPSRFMLRVAMPVVDSGGHKRGILALNLPMNAMLKNASMLVGRLAPHLLLLSQQGFLLDGNDAGYGGQPSVQRLPFALEILAQGESGDRLAADGLWVWLKAEVVPKFMAERVAIKEPWWWVVSHVPSGDILAIRRAEWNDHLPVFGFMLLFSVAISWLAGSREFRGESLPSQEADATLASNWRWRWLAFALSILLPPLMVLVRQSLPESLGSQPMLLLFVFSVTLSAALGGIGPGLVATFTSVLAASYFLLPPLSSLVVESAYNRANLSLLFSNGLLISVLSEALLRARNEAEKRRNAQAVALENLCGSEERLRLMTSSVKDYAIIMLDPEGTIVSWNEGAHRLKGYEEAEILGQPMEVFYTQKDIALGKPHSLLKLASLEGRADDIGMRVRKDGTQFEAEVIISAMRNQSGTLVGFTKITRDVSERNRAGARLHESEMKFRQVLESLPQLVWTCQPDGPCDYLSPQWVAYTGQSEVEQLGYGWLDRIHPEDREPVIERWRTNVVLGDAFQCEYRIRRHDGAYLWFYTLASPLRNESGQIVKWFGSNTDIDDFKRTSEALRLRTQELDQFFSISQDFLCITDAEGCLLRLSHAWQSVLGYSPEQLENQPFIEFVHPDDCRPSLEAFDGLWQGKQVVDFRNRYRAHDGSYRWLEWRSALSSDRRIYAVARDITERIAVEAELDNYRKHLESLVEERTAELQALHVELLDTQFAMDHVGIGIYWVEAETGQIQTSNSYAASMIDYPPGGLDGLHVWDVNPNYPESRYQEMAKAARQQGSLKFETTQLAKSGRWVPVEIMVYYIEGSGGNAARLITFLTDITSRKETERVLIQVKEHAEAATQAKSAFLANMSHEIRTPMNAVLGFCYLLEQQPLEPEALDMARKIHRAGRSLLSLINDILDFSKIESGKLEIEHAPFRLLELLDELASIMTYTLGGKDLEIIIAPPLHVDGLVGDGARLRQVLVNLLGNAIKFTERGQVELRVVQESEAGEKINLRFVIRDTGIGIDQDQQVRIFSAFDQADTSIGRRFGGTGLGLTISKQLVQLMGGELRVTSEPGRGSEFWFSLPLQRDTRAFGLPREIAHLRILVVDDCEEQREALELTIRSLGWQAEAVNSGSDALGRVMAGNGAPLDAILMDWQMPGMDGLAAIQAIKKIPGDRDSRLGHQPAMIMVTAYQRDELLKQPGAAELDSVLCKPVTPSSLYNSVIEIFRQRQGGVLSSPNIAISPGDKQLIGVRVLVVDDTETNLEVARRILEDNGAVVHQASDGQEAVDWLLAHPDAVDIVLMDIQMPVLDGYQATQRIRGESSLAKLPIVALTAGAFQSLRDAARQAGMDDFIAKPFDVDRMIALIRRWTEPQTGAAEPNRLQSSPEPQTVRDLEELSDIDWPAGLKHWGEASVYQTYLEKFVGNYSGAGQALAGYCRNGDLVAAAALAHKFRGASGTLSLPRVAELARRMEETLTAGEPTSESAMAEFQTAIDAACAAIDQRFKNAAPEVSLPPPKVTGCDLDELARLFGELRCALAEYESDAAEASLARLGEWLESPRLAEMRALLADFDYRGTEALARTLMLELNLPTED